MDHDHMLFLIFWIWATGGLSLTILYAKDREIKNHKLMWMDYLAVFIGGPFLWLTILGFGVVFLMEIVTNYANNHDTKNKS